MRLPSFAFHFQIPDGPGAGAPGAPASAPSTSPVTPAPSGAPGGGGGAPAAAGAPGASGFTYQEDRSTWIPPHRLAESTNRVRAMEGRYGELERRYRAIAGLEQPRNEQNDTVRAQFAQVFPELAPLLQNPGALAQVLELARSGGLQELQGTVEAYWGRHAQQTSRELVDKFAKAVGVEASTLSPRVHNRVALHLKSFIEEDSTGQRQYRFEMGDPALVEECLADMSSLFVEPVRRSTAAAAARTIESNRRLPESGARGGIIPPNAAKAPQSRGERREAARQFVLANRGDD